MNTSSLDEVDFPNHNSNADIVAEERDCLITDEHDLTSPGRSKKNAKKYFDIDRPVSPGVKIGSLRPLISLLNCGICRMKKKYCKRMILFLSVIFVLYLVIHQADIRLYFGYTVFDPYPVTNVTVYVHDSCEFDKIRSSSVLPSTEDYDMKVPIQCFDDKVTASDQFLLPRAWDVLPANPCINISNLNSNVCIESSKSSSDHGGVTCLPSFMIIGFEKASTTELLLWLSYHPNLLGKWAETRFFSKVTSPVSF